MALLEREFAEGVRRMVEGPPRLGIKRAVGPPVRDRSKAQPDYGALAGPGVLGCAYCGMPATGKDHVVPKSYVGKLADLEFRVPAALWRTVPACHECNVLAGSRVFRNLEEKRGFLQRRLRERYHDVLVSEPLSEEEIEELGPTLRTAAVWRNRLRGEVLARLAWGAA